MQSQEEYQLKQSQTNTQRTEEGRPQINRAKPALREGETEERRPQIDSAKPTHLKAGTEAQEWTAAKTNTQNDAGTSARGEQLTRSSCQDIVRHLWAAPGGDSVLVASRWHCKQQNKYNKKPPSGSSLGLVLLTLVKTTILQLQVGGGGG